MSVPADLALQQAVGAIGGGGNSSARLAFSDAYEINSVILFGGIAGTNPAGKLLSSLLPMPSSGAPTWVCIPMPGGTALDLQIGEYPFANQAVAGNALIQQPLQVSMVLKFPATAALVSGTGYLSKSSIFTALVQALLSHANLGGLYGVMTPALTYSNCILKRVQDISDAQSNQAQWQWRFDFEQPLLSIQQAQQAQNTLMNKISTGAAIPGTPSYSGPTQPNTSLIPPSSAQ